MASFTIDPSRTYHVERLLQCMQFLGPYLLISEVACMMTSCRTLLHGVREHCYSVTCTKLTSDNYRAIKRLFECLRELSVSKGVMGSYIELGYVLERLTAATLIDFVVPVPADGLMSKKEYPLMKSLKLVSCNSVTLAYVLSCCTHLEYLEIDVVFEDIRELLFRLLRSLKKLKKLRVSRLITPSRDPLVICLSQLEILSVTKSYCVRELKFERGSCEMLSSIDVSRTGIGSKQIVKFVEHCPNLRVLKAAECDGIQDIVEFTALQLRELDLGCCRVQSLLITCPKLQYINLKQCDDLCRLELSASLISSLDISMLNLSFLKICARSLVNLNLRGTLTMKHYLITDDLHPRYLRCWDNFKGVVLLDHCACLKINHVQLTNTTLLLPFNTGELIIPRNFDDASFTDDFDGDSEADDEI
jgi:hypothetical protein